MIERNCGVFTYTEDIEIYRFGLNPTGLQIYNLMYNFGGIAREGLCDLLPCNVNWGSSYECFYIQNIDLVILSKISDLDTFKNKYLGMKVIYTLTEPTYEEKPYELQKIILDGYESGTLFFDTNIPPTVEASYTANIPVVSK